MTDTISSQTVSLEEPPIHRNCGVPRGVTHRLRLATIARSRHWLLLFAFPMLLVSICGCPAPNVDESANASAEIRNRMEQLVTFLDSPSYVASVSWDQHIVLAYRLAQGREPDASEFVLLRELRNQSGLKRSDALALAIAGERQGPTWEQCRQFVETTTPSDFQADSTVTATAQKLAVVSLDSAVKSQEEEWSKTNDAAVADDATIPSALPDQAYSTYFGYLHSHSNLSDGNGPPLGAYIYARDVGGLDFFALTDHGEFMVAWPWFDRWGELRAAADATDEPGRFAALWGFEWSSPVFGHICVLNTSDYTHCVQTIRLRRMYDWIAERPQAFARFNHPGDYNAVNLEFLHFFPYHRARAQIVGVELFNKDWSFDRYYYSGSWSNSFSYWDVGNRNGWYLGALGGQDNHRANWGTRNEFRTAVLAEELTRDAIAEAYRARRFYVTEDKDLHLDFRCQGYPMGARLCGVTREFDVTAWDAGGDSFQQVRLYRSGELLDTASVTGNNVAAAFSDLAETGRDYYYVIVTQTDDNDSNGRPDEAISSPIWIVD